MFRNNIKFKISIIVLLTVILVVGCSKTIDNEVADNNGNNEVADSNEVADNNENQVVNQVQKIVDMAGREVEVPAQIDKVYGVNNNSTFLLYTIVPDKMIGWNFALTEDTKEYINEEYISYPVVGTMYGNGKQADVEEVIKYNPDVIILADTKITEKAIESADDIQYRLELPVVVVEANITNYDEAYEFLGELLNEQERAKELGDYYKETYDFAIENSALIEDKVKVYYARDDNGLTTDFKGSSHTEILDLVGGENVAVMESSDGDTQTSIAKSGTVSIEQLLIWNPEVIIVGYNGSEKTDAFETITTDPLWTVIKAIQNGEVYNIPHAPFNWFDRPPSVNRIIGIKWLGKVLYPDIYTYDLNTEIKKFFKLFYRYDLTDSEVEDLLSISNN